VPPAGRALWLDPHADAAALRALLVPLEAAEMEAYEVSALVNSPRNDSPECVREVN
jgi:putative SOS response-associated peptidase YedK